MAKDKRFLGGINASQTIKGKNLEATEKGSFREIGAHTGDLNVQSPLDLQDNSIKGLSKALMTNLDWGVNVELLQDAKDELRGGVSVDGDNMAKLYNLINAFDETDPTVPSFVKSILSGDIDNWNEAYAHSQTIHPVTPNLGELNINSPSYVYGKTTSNIIESPDNLYYTEDRVSANADVVLNSEHRALVIGNPHGVTLEEARLENNVINGDIDFSNNSALNINSVSFYQGEALSWNSKYNTINVPTGNGTVLKSGIDTSFPIHNATGTTLTAGCVVYPDGTSTNGVSNVQLAIADSHETLESQLGIVAYDILDGADGNVTIGGVIDPIDTSLLSEGSVWLSATTPGKLTSVKPEFPNYKVLMGVVDFSDINGALTVDSEFNLQNTFVNFWNGTVREKFNFKVTSDGATITGALTPANGHPNVTLVFSDGLSTFNISGINTIDLIPGAAGSPQENFVYITRANKVLEVSTAGFPNGEEHIKISQVVLRDTLNTQQHSALKVRNHNDEVEDTNSHQGHLSHITERLRKEYAKWDSGVEGILTEVNNDVYFGITGGVIYQLHAQEIDTIQMPTHDIHIINDFTNPYSRTANINTVVEDALGNDLKNSSFSFVFWGIGNSSGEPNHIMMNVPTGSYSKNSPNQAVEDPSNYSVYTIPKLFQGVGFLIGRGTMTLEADGTTWSIYDYEDLRGRVPNTTAGGGSTGSGTSSWTALVDTPNSYLGFAGKFPKVSPTENALIFSNVDLASDVSGILPDSNLSSNVALLSSPQTFGSDVTVSGNLTVNGTTTQINTEIQTADSVILMNDGELGVGVTLGYAGLEIDRGTQENYFFGFDEVRDAFAVGQIASLSLAEIATTQILATRADSLANQSLTKWDSTSMQFVDSGKLASDLDQLHSPLTIAGESYASLSGQQITFSDINLASNVTGTLADGNLSSNVALLNAANTFTQNQTINTANIATLLSLTNTNASGNRWDIASVNDGAIDFSQFGVVTALRLLGATGNAEFANNIDAQSISTNGTTRIDANGNFTGGSGTFDGAIYGRQGIYPSSDGFYALIPVLSNANQGGLKIQTQTGGSGFLDAMELDFNGDVYIPNGNLDVTGSGTFSGNVAIGKTTPRSYLDLGFSGQGTLSNTVSQHQIILEAPSGTGNFGRNIGWSESTGANVITASINAVDEGTSGATGIAVSTGNSTSITERLRINSSGIDVIGGGTFSGELSTNNGSNIQSFNADGYASKMFMHGTSDYMGLRSLSPNATPAEIRFEMAINGSSNVSYVPLKINSSGIDVTGSGTFSGAVNRPNNTGVLLLEGGVSPSNSSGAYIALYGVDATSQAGEAILVSSGTGSAQVWHQGSKKLETTPSGIDVTGSGTFSGNLLIDQGSTAANPRLTFRHSTTASDGYIQLNRSSGNVDLFSHSSVKLSTTSSGIDVTGNVVASGTIKSQAIQLQSTGTIVNEYSLFRNADYLTMSGGANGFRFNNSINSISNFVLSNSGNGSFVGTVTATNFILSSDERLKTFKDDEEVVNVDSIKIRKFVYNDDETNRDRYGVSAQELQKVAPEMVYEDSDEDKTLRVGYIDFLLAKISNLEERLNKGGL